MEGRTQFLLMQTVSNNSRTRRWTVLFIVAFVMMMGYVFWDIVSPLSTTLKASVKSGGMGWTAAEYGFYAGSYSIFNIFLLMLFWGGIILDKCGIRFTGILATGMMLSGAAINYLAVTVIWPFSYVDLPFTLFGLIPSHIKTQVLADDITIAPNDGTEVDFDDFKLNIKITKN